MDKTTPSIGDMLREFHDAFDLGNPTDVIRALPHELTALRMRLHEEEYGEMLSEVWKLDSPEEREVLDLAKEAADLIYVGAGSLVALGMDPERVVELVHRSNMTKLHECLRCHGEGELEVGVSRDVAVGAWNTETVKCDHCHGTGKVVVKDEGGKVVKPDTYEDPNLEELLR